jgi:predicted RNA-binding Zn-ribbon protein involved in translation (DUF1610 family)
MTGATRECVWCGRGITFSDAWVHADGGGAYWMLCPECRWEGAPVPTPLTCPKCGSWQVRDDHCAMPGMPNKR